jgi:hypothetical protein
VRRQIREADAMARGRGKGSGEGVRGRCWGKASTVTGGTVGGVSTRTLLILSAITGLMILVAFAVQVSILGN